MPKVWNWRSHRECRPEEELADDHGEEDEDDEVVEFEGAAQRRQAQGFVILSIEGRPWSCDVLTLLISHVSHRF